MVGEIINWLRDLLPDIQETRDPEGVLTKFAKEKNLAPAILEKMANVYNTAKTLKYWEKTAGEQRGLTFPVINAEELAEKYAEGYTPEKKATEDEDGWLAKSASETTPDEEEYVLFKGKKKNLLDLDLGEQEISMAGWREKRLSIKDVISSMV